MHVHQQPYKRTPYTHSELIQYIMFQMHIVSNAYCDGEVIEFI